MSVLVSNPGGSSSFETDGPSGITKERWQSTPGGVLYDVTVSDAGAFVFTPVSTTPDAFNFTDNSGFNFIDNTEFDFIT